MDDAETIVRSVSGTTYYYCKTRPAPLSLDLIQQIFESTQNKT